VQGIPKPCVASWRLLTYLLTNPVSRTRFPTNLSGLDCRSYRVGRPSPHIDGMEEVRVGSFDLVGVLPRPGVMWNCRAGL
jgi:hypothetical protein